MEARGWIDWHASVRPMPGESVCGDAWVAASRPNGLLLAVIDGLGHGAAAAEASNRACRILHDSAEEQLEVLATLCHRALRDTRGAAVTLAFIHRDGRLRWLGVGNVEAVVVRARTEGGSQHDSLMLLPGVIGYHVPALREAEIRLSAGDTLVMATDGVRSSFVEALSGRDTPARTAQRILDDYGKRTDDALVLAAALVGGAE